MTKSCILHQTTLSIDFVFVINVVMTINLQTLSTLWLKVKLHSPTYGDKWNSTQVFTACTPLSHSQLKHNK